MNSFPDGWHIKPLSEVVSIQRGFDLPHHARRPGPFPVLTSGETGGFHDEGPIKGPGVTIGRATNLGQPKWSEGDFWPHNTTMFVKDFRGNHPRWVYHYFENTDLAGYDSGSVQPMLNRNYIAHIPVLVPSTQEQRAIADVLGALDDKIAVNSKLAETSDELVSLHFRRAIESEGTASRPLFEAIDIDFGEPFGGSDFSAPGIGRPLIRIRDLKTFTSQVWTTEIRSREILVQPGDVVVGMDAEFRPTSWLGEPGLLNQRVCRARGKSTGPAFVRETLREPLRRIEGYKAATTVIHLNKKDLQEAEVLVPDTESLELFEASVEGLYSRRVAVAIENRALEAVRDALLPQLMSGKLRVRDAEKVLENAGV